MDAGGRDLVSPPQDFLGPGTGPIPLGSGGSGLSAFPVESFTTSILDLTQVVAGLELVPARAGYIPRLGGGFWDIEQVVGTQTNPPTIQAGSDTAHSNFIASTNATPSNASTNAAATPCVISGPNQASGGGVQSLTNATIFVDITVGATGTGGFVLKGRFVVNVLWMAVG
jgi:hypothetical protein